MIIPRERIATGQYLTRLYVQVKDDEVPPSGGLGVERAMSSTTSRERRAAITLESIFAQAERVFYPYKIAIMDGTVVDWWAAYQIGQRMAPNFSLRDDAGIERVFIVGDGKCCCPDIIIRRHLANWWLACHTHSPKAGQGMNVSMMDSYNLSWKLVHSVHGLTPRQQGSSSDPVLATFGHERVGVARQLIDFDSKFSSMFSGQMGLADPEANHLTHEMFLKVFSEGSGFTSGCGIEYGDSVLVHDTQTNSSENPVTGTNYLQGILKTGRRLPNVLVKRFADSNIRNLQDGKSSYPRAIERCYTSS